MKTESTLKASAEGRLKQGRKNALRAHDLMDSIETKFDKNKMAELRAVAEDMLQCVHEFNAYHNALNT